MFAEIQDITEITQLVDIRTKLIAASAGVDEISPAFSGTDSSAPTNFNIGHNLFINKYQTKAESSLDLRGCYVGVELLNAAKTVLRAKQSAVESRLLVLGVKSIPDVIPLSIKDAYFKDVSMPAFVVPTSGGNGGTILYNSDNAIVATVDQLSGVVRVVADGVATITAIEEGTLNSITSVITVYPAISLEPSVYYFTDSIPQLAYFSGGSGNFSFTSSNPAVAGVNSTTGEITLVANGQSSIQITDVITENSRSYVVNVVDHMTLSASATMLTNQTYLPIITGGSGLVEYTSSNTELMAVDLDTGLMDPIAAGSVTLTAADLYTSEFKTFDITVYKLATVNEIDLLVLDTHLIIPTGGTGNYTYSITNTDIATVDVSGLVTAVSVGTTTIVVTDTTTGETANTLINVA
jgi:hypothetical protein